MFKRPDQLTTFRLNYYPQHEQDYEASEISAQDGVKLACETHTDSVIFTILYQDMVGGEITITVYVMIMGKGKPEKHNTKTKILHYTCII